MKFLLSPRHRAPLLARAPWLLCGNPKKFSPRVFRHLGADVTASFYSSFHRKPARWAISQSGATRQTLVLGGASSGREAVLLDTARQTMESGSGLIYFLGHRPLPMMNQVLAQAHRSGRLKDVLIVNLLDAGLPILPPFEGIDYSTVLGRSDIVLVIAGIPSPGSSRQHAIRAEMAKLVEAVKERARSPGSPGFYSLIMDDWDLGLLPSDTRDMLALAPEAGLSCVWSISSPFDLPDRVWGDVGCACDVKLFMRHSIEPSDFSRVFQPTNEFRWAFHDSASQTSGNAQLLVEGECMSVAMPHIPAGQYPVLKDSLMSWTASRAARAYCALDQAVAQATTRQAHSASRL